MNGKPHAHEVVITQADTYITVTYGDQASVFGYPIFGTVEAKMERVARRLIRDHDLASIQAEAKGVPRQRVEARLNEKLRRYPNNQWGSSLLDET